MVSTVELIKVCLILKSWRNLKFFRSSGANTTFLRRDDLDEWETSNTFPNCCTWRWQTQRGVVTIPKSVTESRINENIQVSQVSGGSSTQHGYSFGIAVSLFQHKETGSHEKLLICQIFDFTLDVDEMKSVTMLNKNWRYIVPIIEVSKSVLLFLFWRL